MGNFKDLARQLILQCKSYAWILSVHWPVDGVKQDYILKEIERFWGSASWIGPFSKRDS